VLGVLANPSDECVIREFFELFKTPWEFYSSDRFYDVVLCTEDAVLDEVSARLVVVYGGDKTSFDAGQQVQIGSMVQGGLISFSGATIPVYGPTLRFQSGHSSILDDGSGESIAYVAQLEDTRYARVGYDLIYEIRTLLLQGQPSTNAAIPTLELHIELLRQLITGCGLPLVEIPPTPYGHSFIACLTHDLDHASIRRHKFDATMCGFLYRATVVSALNTARGRMSLRGLFTNWAAVAKLPFVYMGLAEDFWYGFDRYLDLEEGRPSTFFVIPFANRPGHGPNGKAPLARGAGYDVSHVATKIKKLRDAGCEIGLHGIDAWSDSGKAREESRRISDVSSQRALGVRMHWLYGDERSPAVLEDADFSYDSTVGYNETVGYRAGTSQVFKPLNANRLLELPLHVMDTALFYPDYLGLSDDEAWAWLKPFFDNAMLRGGVLTVNWHDRSIAPERLWGNFYVRLLSGLTQKGALFCTAAQTVAWFRKRRSAVFQRADNEGRFYVTTDDSDPNLPPLRLRFHRPRSSPKILAKADNCQEGYTDVILNGRMEFRLAWSEGKSE
jgi:hypothetical protein